MSIISVFFITHCGHAPPPRPPPSCPRCAHGPGPAASPFSDTGIRAWAGSIGDCLSRQAQAGERRPVPHLSRQAHPHPRFVSTRPSHPSGAPASLPLTRTTLCLQSGQSATPPPNLPRPWGEVREPPTEEGGVEAPLELGSGPPRRSRGVCSRWRLTSCGHNINLIFYQAGANLVRSDWSLTHGMGGGEAVVRAVTA